MLVGLKSFPSEIWQSFLSGSAADRLSIASNAITVVTGIAAIVGGISYAVRNAVSVDRVFGILIFLPITLAFEAALFLAASVLWHKLLGRNDLSKSQRNVYASIVWLVFISVAACFAYVFYAYIFFPLFTR